MIPYLNGIVVGLVAPHAATALAKGDGQSLALAAAIIGLNALCGGLAIFGGRS